MPQCAVFGCNNASGREKIDSETGSVISYHKIPSDKSLRKSWINRLSRKDWEPTKNAVVCSIHFKPIDFEPDMYSRIMGTDSRPRRLKNGAVPSMFLRGQKRLHPSELRSTSACLDKRNKLEEAENLQQLLQNDTETNSIELSPSVDIGLTCHPETHDRKIQFRPSTSHAFVEARPTLQNASTQTDISTCECSALTDSSPEEDSSSDIDEYIPSDESPVDSDVEPDLKEFEESTASSNVFLCFVDKIVTLLKFCPKCASPVETRRIHFEGSMLCATLTCINGCRFTWSSQPTLSQMSCRSGLGDFYFASSFILCGGTYALLRSVADCMQMGIFSATFYYDVQRHYLAPVVFSNWSAQQEVILQELSEKPSVRIAGDARCDSPGFSSKYSTYTMMDIDSGYVVCGRVVQIGQETNSSVMMEKVGFNSCLDCLIDHDISVSVVATDRSPSVIKEMKDNYPEIVHQHDVWHIAKSLKKSIVSSSKKKSTAILNEWLRSIINHLYYSTQHCDEDPEKLIELWLSELKHIRGIHDWEHDDSFKKVLKCSHENSDIPLARQGLRKQYLENDSEAFLTLRDIVSAPRLLTALRHCTLSLSTASLENLHSVMLKYVPKRLHFNFLSMNMRTILAYLDHNNNVERELKHNCKYQFSKVTGKWVARRLYLSKTYSWRRDLMKEAVQLRISGILPHDCEAPFSHIPHPRNIAPVPMPSKEDLDKSLLENSRHIS